MSISKLEIKNFHNVGDPPFVITLKPFTLLLGENNVGKSNLLVAVLLLFGQEPSSAQRRILDIDGARWISGCAVCGHGSGKPRGR
jgi:chromosome segregation ATPase